MTHDKDLSNTDLAASSAKRRDACRGLPMPGWPDDLFKYDATEAELMTENLPVWHDSSISMSDHRYWSMHA